MADSNVTYTAAPAQTAFTLTFEFLKQAHVNAEIDGITELDFTIAGSTLTFGGTVALAGGEEVRLFRETPRTLATQQVQFTGGSALTEDDLTTEQTQRVYIDQEAYDEAERVRVLLMEAEVSGGNLPTVDGTDNGSMLLVTAGAWVVTDEDGVRAQLGLHQEHWSILKMDTSIPALPNGPAAWEESAAARIDFDSLSQVHDGTPDVETEGTDILKINTAGKYLLTAWVQAKGGFGATTSMSFAVTDETDGPAQTIFVADTVIFADQESTSPTIVGTSLIPTIITVTTTPIRLVLRGNSNNANLGTFRGGWLQLQRLRD